MVSRAREFMRLQPFSFTMPDHGAFCSYTEMNSEKASSSADICRGGATTTSSSASREGAASSSADWLRWCFSAEGLGFLRHSGDTARSIVESSEVQPFPGKFLSLPPEHVAANGN